MLTSTKKLSIGAIIRHFRGKVAITWGLTLLETTLFAFIPLLLGLSIDGLLADDWQSFYYLLAVLAALLIVATGRRVYDTRAYGTIRVELNKALFLRSESVPISSMNARALMARELVDFLETEAPEAMTSVVHVVVSLIILFTFHSTLALSAGLATIAIVAIYALAAGHFLRVNRDLNEQSERQVVALESRDIKRVTQHFLIMRRHEVRLSDTESVVYGIIFFVMLSMLAFNLWFAATQADASTGEIFSIVTYSFDFVQSAVALPIVLQTLTRLQEITERINSKVNPESSSR
ncbi:hypothetical protein CHH28_02600 [Bacterioplanes sanyensis]|uniref:ABC transmembrane type-1 domain-containing protein n=1 Tax=Bacterioplanes sanyensis TaxID=1249553 RepID=A0A222FGB1_9GAMM|nr:ABC transporter six-transmembrane domain-containing protein [Bacterioplanes sanyensis]ASP37626.1 hypothetical protein CHH28_02600 [Bacterioplanes sanyensis]